MSHFAEELRDLRCTNYFVPMVEGHPKVTHSVPSNKNRMIVDRVDAKVVVPILEVFKEEYLNGEGSFTQTSSICPHFTSYGEVACHAGYVVEWNLFEGKTGRFEVYIVGIMGIARICVTPQYGDVYISDIGWHSIPHLKRFLKSSILKLVRKRHYMLP